VHVWNISSHRPDIVPREGKGSIDAHLASPRGIRGRRVKLGESRRTPMAFHLDSCAGNEYQGDDAHRCSFSGAMHEGPHHNQAVTPLIGSCSEDKKDGLPVREGRGEAHPDHPYEALLVSIPCRRDYIDRSMPKGALPAVNEARADLGGLV